MLIVPIRSYDQVVGWKGEGYPDSSIVLVGEPKTDIPLPEDFQVSDDKKKRGTQGKPINQRKYSRFTRLDAGM